MSQDLHKISYKSFNLFYFQSISTLTCVIFSRFFIRFSRSIFQDEEKGVKLTSRERRFIKFASVEFDGQLYMTPQDFLDSVVEQEARREFFLKMIHIFTLNTTNLNLLFSCVFSARLKRRTLTLDEVNKVKDITPPLKKGSSSMFRNLRDKGIISYTEYLFLLSILTSKLFSILFLKMCVNFRKNMIKCIFLYFRAKIGL